jgi:hypothetical protein
MDQWRKLLIENDFQRARQGLNRFQQESESAFGNTPNRPKSAVTGCSIQRRPAAKGGQEFMRAAAGALGGGKGRLGFNWL